MDGNIVSKRLKELRENAILSHEKLAVALQEKYEIQIAVASLKKYEKPEYYKDIINKDGEKRRELYSAVKGMRIEYLYMFADFYGVPTDYILGRTNSKSKDLKEQAIYDKYGLSVEALKNLETLWNNKNKEFKKIFCEFNPVFVFDYMLSNMDFTSKFSFHLIRYCEFKINQSMPRILREKTNLSDNEHLLGISTDINIERYFAINKIEQIIDSFYNEYINFLNYKYSLDLEKNTKKQKGAQLNGKENK